MGSPAITKGECCPGASRSLAKLADADLVDGSRSRRVGRRRMSGVAAVEFALVVPLLLVVLFGIIDFGFMLYDKAMLTNAAREGARAGIVLRETRLTPGEVEAVAHDYCRTRMIRLGGSGDCTARVSRTGTASLVDTLTVSVDYTYDGPIVNLIGLIGGSLELGTMTSTAVMKYE